MAATSRGIDVSSYQGAQDWAALARGGLTFAQAKASEGLHKDDPHYRMHMDGIRRTSLLPGAYHFAWPNQPATAEADHYISLVRPDAEAEPGFHHWLDLERNREGTNYAGCTAAEIRAYAEAWIARVKAAFPRQRVGVYTSGSDIKAGHYPRNADALWYPAYPAGALSYTQAEQRSRPNPGVTPLFWQFTSAPVDRSIAYMTPAQLRTWAGGATTTVREDDMPLTDDDVRRIARQVVTGANGLHAPGDPATEWAISAYLPAIYRQQAAQGAAITALAQQLGKGKDVQAIVAAVQDAIATATVHVAVDVTGTGPAPADPAPTES